MKVLIVILRTRASGEHQDITVNKFGRYLLCVCEQFDLIVLYGLMPGDEDGKFTYIAHNGSSTIDYFIMSRSLVHMVSHLHVVSRIEPNHMPAEIKFKLLNTFHDVANKPRKYKLQKYVWDQTKHKSILLCILQKIFPRCLNMLLI